MPPETESYSALRNVQNAVAALKTAMESPDKVFVNDKEIAGGDHFQIMDVGLVVYDKRGQSVAAFAPGNWFTCILVRG